MKRAITLCLAVLCPMGPQLCSGQAPTLIAGYSSKGTPGQSPAFRSTEALAASLVRHRVQPGSTAGVLVDVRLNIDATTVQPHLLSAGATVLRLDPASGSALVRVPSDRIAALERVPGVRYLTAPEEPVPQRVGRSHTEGDAVVRADQARLHGLTGSTVSVGVLATGIDEIGQSQLTGDLPVDVTAESFRMDQRLDVDAEGTAILEIVHDLAPDARLYFANVGVANDVAPAMGWLSANCDVIVSDLVFFRSGPYDGSSAVSQAMTNAARSGAAVVQAVGNHALDHFEGVFTDANRDEFHDFANESIRLVLFPNERITVVLQWDDSWLDSVNDYDLFLFDYDALAVAAKSEDTQNPSSTLPPLESLEYTNNTAQAQNLGVLVRKFRSADAVRTIEIFLAELTTGRNGIIESQYNVPAGSVPNMADAVDVLSVGAVPFQATQSIEPFSSRGPTNDGRIKPDVAAPNRVSTSRPSFSTFVGTSAAAPHVAGSMALLVEFVRKSMLTNLSEAPLVASAFLNGAVDLGETGPDNTFGHGLISAVNAGHLLAQDPSLLVADIDGNGTVENVDIIDLLSDWGNAAHSPTDLDWTGRVEQGDVLVLSRQWGAQLGKQEE